MQPIESAIILKQELDTLRPLNAEDEKRIMQKLRLDWNYHSNHLEGNSLTYGETKALILFGSTAQGKPLKDHIEMTGHNEALRLIEEIVREERPLTESFIRELNKLILKEDYQAGAITSDGKPTKKWVRVGKYKTEPNHVKTVTGEIFYFATPEETPAKMHDLLEWYREKLAHDDIQPILLAAEFHYRFIRIHPLDDGNGRTARILMNFILMQFGYPPTIIKTEDKENYFAVLRQADAGLLMPFVEYVATNVVHSLEIMIKGAKGEAIEEPDDLDKELALLEQRFKSAGEKIEINKSREAILEFYDGSVIPLFKKFVAAGKRFEGFYLKKEYNLFVNGGGYGGIDDEKLLKKLKGRMNDEVTNMNMYYHYETIDRNELKDFEYTSGIRINFDYVDFTVHPYSSNLELTKSYGQQLTEEEINQLVKSEAKRHKEILEQKIEEID